MLFTEVWLSSGRDTDTKTSASTAANNLRFIARLQSCADEIDTVTIGSDLRPKVACRTLFDGEHVGHCQTRELPTNPILEALDVERLSGLVIVDGSKSIGNEFRATGGF